MSEYWPKEYREEWYMLLTVWPSTSHMIFHILSSSIWQVFRRDSQDLKEDRVTRWNRSGAPDARWRIGPHKTSSWNINVGFLNEEEINPYYVKEVRFGSSFYDRYPTWYRPKLPFELSAVLDFSKSKFQSLYYYDTEKIQYINVPILLIL